MMLPKATLAVIALVGAASAQTSTGSSTVPTFTFPFANSSSTSTSSSSSSSTSLTSSSSSSSATASTSVPLPSATNLPYPFILGIQNTPPAGAVAKRQAAGFIGNAGPANPTDCGLATQFTLVNGQLVSGGEVVSTDPGVAYIALQVSANPGAITTVWGVTGDVVEWVNPAFAGGQAAFYQVGTGQVYATFAGPGNVPAGAVPVGLVAYPATQCVDGSLVDATATLTLPADFYFPDATPAAECCSPVFESWIIGQTTLLP